MLLSLNISNLLVLIKSILQAMPLYLFSVLVAPKWVLKAIRTLQRTFLWNGGKNTHHWALVKWDTICGSKSNGGLSLWDPEQSNETLSVKIWWHWITKNNSQSAQVWNKKYAPNWHTQQLVRFSKNIKGSLIWNATNYQ